MIFTSPSFCVILSCILIICMCVCMCIWMCICIYVNMYVYSTSRHYCHYIINVHLNLPTCSNFQLFLIHSSISMSPFRNIFSLFKGVLSAFLLWKYTGTKYLQLLFMWKYFPFFFLRKRNKGRFSITVFITRLFLGATK